MRWNGHLFTAYEIRTEGTLKISFSYNCYLVILSNISLRICSRSTCSFSKKIAILCLTLPIKSSFSQDTPVNTSYATLTQDISSSDQCNSTSNLATVNSNPAWKAVFENRIWLMPVISFVSIAAITYIVSQIVRKGREYLYNDYLMKEPNSKVLDDDCEKDKKAEVNQPKSFKKLGRNFWDIIREGDYFPSFARFQFLAWTFIISFVFLSIYLLRLAGAECDIIQVSSPSIFQMMGLSAGTPVLANLILRYKYDTSLTGKFPDKVAPFSTMLLEGNKLVSFRYQMLLWTFLGIGIYPFKYFSLPMHLSSFDHIPRVDRTYSQ
jgi:hypothetical protein